MSSIFSRHTHAFNQIVNTLIRNASTMCAVSMYNFMEQEGVKRILSQAWIGECVRWIMKMTYI